MKSKAAERAKAAKELANELILLKNILGEMYVNRIAPAHRPADDDVDSWALSNGISLLTKAANHVLVAEGLPEYRPKMESNCRPITEREVLERLNKPNTVVLDFSKQAHQIHE